jgi:hypothetical protein
MWHQLWVRGEEMARYIDADKVLQELPDDLPYKASVKRVLIQAPTADVVEVKHGEWKENKIEYMLYGCSNCDCRVDYEFNYCPNCGAKMEGE